MDFQRFFDAFEEQTKNVSLLTQRVEELRLSNLQLMQAVKKAERLPHILDPASKKLVLRFREQALACEREVLRQQRAKKMQQIEREMAASKSNNVHPHKSPAGEVSKINPTPVVNPHDFSALSRVRTRGTMKSSDQPAEAVTKQSSQHKVSGVSRVAAPVVASTGGAVSTSMSTEDELSNTVIAKDRLDFFRQVGSGGTHGAPDMSASGVTGSLLDQVNLESPSAVTCGHDEVIDVVETPNDLIIDAEDMSACGANTTTGTGFYTNSTDILQYMRHSTNTITSMFTLQEEEEEDSCSRRQPPTEAPVPPVCQPVSSDEPGQPNGGTACPGRIDGERQHLTRYLIEASLPDDDDEDIQRRVGNPTTRIRQPTKAQPGDQNTQLGLHSRPWDTLMEEQFEAQAELGMKLQEEIRAQEERLRAQMQLFNQMRNNSAATSNNDTLRSVDPMPAPSPGTIMGIPTLPRPPSQLSPQSMSRHTPYPPVLRSDEDSLRLIHPIHDDMFLLPTTDTMSPELHAKFCRISAVVKGYLTRQLYQSDKAQNILRTVKDTAECALFLSESTDNSGSIVNHRQDHYLRSRLVTQLQASLFEFHDLFFASTPAYRMSVIAATREARLQRLQQFEEKTDFETERSMPEKEAQDRQTPKLSAATRRRIEMREKGQLNSVVSPRYVNKPNDKSPPPDSATSRPSTAPAASHPRAHARILRPLHLQQQLHKHAQPKTQLNSQPAQRSRSLNAGKVGPVRPSTAPLKRGQPHRLSLPQSGREIRPIHVVTVKDSGKQMRRKVRATINDQAEK